MPLGLALSLCHLGLAGLDEVHDRLSLPFVRCISQCRCGNGFNALSLVDAALHSHSAEFIFAEIITVDSNFDSRVEISLIYPCARILLRQCGMRCPELQKLLHLCIIDFPSFDSVLDDACFEACK